MPCLSERFNLFPKRVRPRVVHRLAAGCDVFPASVVVSEEGVFSVVCEPLASLNRRVPLSGRSIRILENIKIETLQ